MTRLLFAAIIALPIMGATAFEAASIRVNADGGEKNNRPAEEKIVMEPGGLRMTNVTLVRCLREAYGVYAFQIGAPEWMSSVRYDIAARAADAAPEDQLRLMLQQLLADRFHLTLHREQRNLNLYSLERGKQEPRLRDAQHPDSKVMGLAGGAVLFRGYSMADFIAALSGPPFRVDRPVRDMTGLTGKYDFELKIAPDEAGMKSVFEGMLKAGGDAPSVINLVQDQIGLRFKAEKASRDSLVVDSAEKTPTAN
ncbi:MAG TPA: TIGR03435 family protein [Bryobacteraceae bacterium]|nr:TIGR03435 family protein [Bryobacteraceae bacterium]